MNPTDVWPVVRTAPVAPPAPTQMDTNAYVLAYRQLRDKKDEIKKKHAEELKPYNEKMDQLEAALLDYLNQSNAESQRTKDGTFFKVRRTTYKVSDAAEFRAWIEANAQIDMLEARVSKSVIEEWLKLGHPLPPGIDVSTEVEVQVRKAA